VGGNHDGDVLGVNESGMSMKMWKSVYTVAQAEFLPSDRPTPQMWLQG
jgi:hypothetical protein